MKQLKKAVRQAIAQDNWYFALSTIKSGFKETVQNTV